MADIQKIEYSIRPVTRYYVTRYVQGHNSASSEPKGEFDNPDIAYEVANALCKDEHSRLGWPVGDARITYPSIDAHRPGQAVQLTQSQL